MTPVTVLRCPINHGARVILIGRHSHIHHRALMKIFPRYIADKNIRFQDIEDMTPFASASRRRRRKEVVHE